jgi:transposase
MATAIELEQQNAELRQQLHWATLKIQLLEEKLRKKRIELLGPFSENLSDLQLQLLLEVEPGVSAAEVEAEARREPVTPPVRRREKPHPGRQTLPADLPRVEKIIPCSDPNCQQCGAPTTVMGYDESEQLDVEPARYFVLVTKREKRTCAACSTVQMPVLEPRIIEKGLASDRVVVATVVNKYCDHLPLYRQEAMLEREAGLTISRGTLDGWVMVVGESLVPVVEGMRRDLLLAPYLQADETTVPVQMHDKRGADHQAYLWQYGKPGGETVFDFQLGRGREGPAKFLKDWSGILQTDGYQSYDQIGGPGMVRVGCWAHARRKFVDAVKVNPKDADAEAMVLRMDGLFLVDRAARQDRLDAGERGQLRREHALPFLDEIRGACWQLRARVLPSSVLGQAVTYTLTQWDKLARCFEYDEVELSTNLAENSMRPIALGRKNWLHVGSAKAGPKVAAILSVVESCRRLKLSINDYLLSVLPGLNRRTTAQAAELTPARWAATVRS